ncbi:MAG: 7-cyano-7-deazaguanine synthase QueC [Gemmatales bacterium]|nr:7-cyano-7-deazaguanine synthase QueC [Gemmatales bacterium]MDW8221744.1 7-cyano-7-deazaguanine synthase QueC [Gemmatales bacterium]
MQAKAVVLVSGGLDSATTLAVARSQGYAAYALTVDYGQRHRRELEAARRIAESLDTVEHRIVRVDLRALGGSALTDEIAVPKDRTVDEIGQGIPITYVPARNTVFLALALGYAEVIGAFDLFIGCNAIDYSGYPDCRPEFLQQFEALANVATRAGVEGRGVFRVHAPLLYMSKAQIIREGKSLGVDFRLTHSCYDPTPDNLACGRCDSCRLRLKGFLEAQERDPIGYAYVPPEYAEAAGSCLVR